MTPLTVDELATILVALRSLQKSVESDGYESVSEEWFDFFETVGAGGGRLLGIEEIDELCVRLNMEDGDVLEGLELVLGRHVMEEALPLAEKFAAMRTAGIEIESLEQLEQTDWEPGSRSSREEG